MNGLEKLALVFSHLGVIYLLDQLSVFVDEPCFPEYIGSCVLYLRVEDEQERTFNFNIYIILNGTRLVRWFKHWS